MHRAVIASLAFVVLTSCGMPPLGGQSREHPWEEVTGVPEEPEWRVARTMEVMGCVRSAFEAYSESGGPPSMASMQDPFGLPYPFAGSAGEEFLLRDAWGRQMQVRTIPPTSTANPSDKHAISATVISAGADGQFDEASWFAPGENATPGEDLLLGFNRWIRWARPIPPALSAGHESRDRLGVMRFPWPDHEVRKYPFIGDPEFELGPRWEPKFYRAGAYEAWSLRTDQGIVQTQWSVVARAMLDMVEIAMSLERYHDAHGAYPNPSTCRRPDSEFMATMAAPDFLLEDAWGHAIRLLVSSGAKDAERDEYLLVSAGADGLFDARSWGRREKSATPDDDLVIRNGQWVRWARVHCCRSNYLYVPPSLQWPEFMP